MLPNQGYPARNRAAARTRAASFALARGASASSRSTSTGSTAAAITTCSAGTPTWDAPSTATARPRRASRSIRTARNVYLDTFNSAYGAGWKRENSFLAHKPRGNFCYGFFPRKSYYDRSRRPAAHGKRYRATAIGPGVSPDPFWEADGLGDYDPAHEAEMNALGDSIAGPDRSCRQH